MYLSAVLSFMLSLTKAYLPKYFIVYQRSSCLYRHLIITCTVVSAPTFPSPFYLSSFPTEGYAYAYFFSTGFIAVIIILIFQQVPWKTIYKKFSVKKRQSKVETDYIHKQHEQCCILSLHVNILNTCQHSHYISTLYVKK